MSRFNLFDGLFDFDGDGKVDENDALLGSLFMDHDSDWLQEHGDPDDDDEADPFDAQDYSSAEEFYEEHSGDFADFEDAEDYYNDWN